MSDERNAGTRNEEVERLLDRIEHPSDLRELCDQEDLQQVVQEIRDFIVEVVSSKGGHFGGSLGVAELTVALHYVFNTPYDRIVWDVGHQAYGHKILTGRRERMDTMRKWQGLAGFPKRDESEYDTFGTGHSSTSISAALGMAVAAKQRGDDRRVVAVIGDGAMTAGMAFEALNHAGDLGQKNLVVVLNDNEMSISPNVGALSSFLSRKLSAPMVRRMKHWAKDFLGTMPGDMVRWARKAEESMKVFFSPGLLFEALGFKYVGPIEGHRMDVVLETFENVRSMLAAGDGPILVHAFTNKGRGYGPAERDPFKYHGVGSFDVESGEFAPSKPGPPKYQDVFGDTLVRLAGEDERIVGITAAMAPGTGLDRFEKAYPGRFYDVGIAEQHAVTFAGGLATGGMKPVAAIYSTFLQRAYDQVVHDVAIQGLPVRFCLDRAGLVGADGATHAGSYDVAYLSNLPGFVVMAASDESELMHMVATAAAHDAGPIAFRYPRGEGVGVDLPERGTPLEIGKGRIVQEGRQVAVLSFGARLPEVRQAAEALAQRGITPTIADARFAKPLDRDLILDLAREHEALITIEEGAIGGFGSHVAQLLAEEGVFDTGIKYRSMVLPDIFIDQASPRDMYTVAGLNAADIEAKVLGTLGIATLGKARA